MGETKTLGKVREVGALKTTQDGGEDETSAFLNFLVIKGEIIGIEKRGVQAKLEN